VELDIKDKHIHLAGKICSFLLELSNKDFERWQNVLKNTKTPYPFGDLSYAMALDDWRQRNCPTQAFFSYAEGEVECPYLMEYRKELTEEFGLKICTQEEAESELKKMTRPLLRHKVLDWGLN